ncbi:MAG TPA: hypothetical protein VGM16_05080, partial [Gammaproteobacteria bacterium]
MDIRKTPESSLLLVLALFAGSVIGAPPGVGGPMVTRSVYIFQSEQGAQLLKQCSRNVPQHVSGYWTPDDAQITAFKAALEIYVRQHSADRGDVLSHPLDSYHGQYI